MGVKIINRKSGKYKGMNVVFTQNGQTMFVLYQCEERRRPGIIRGIAGYCGSRYIYCHQIYHNDLQGLAQANEMLKAFGQEEVSSFKELQEVITRAQVDNQILSWDAGKSSAIVTYNDVAPIYDASGKALAAEPATTSYGETLYISKDRIVGTIDKFTHGEEITELYRYRKVNFHWDGEEELKFYGEKFTEWENGNYDPSHRGEHFSADDILITPFDL